MPHRQSQYVFDYCPKCKSSTGSVYLRQWKKPGVYLRAEDIRGMTINQRRAMTGLPPYNDEELAELNMLNQEFIDNGRIIAASLIAIVSVLPHLLKNHADLFPAPVVYHIFHANTEFMESINDDSPKKIDWGRWLSIATAYEKYGSYRAASRKTRFQSWDKVWHQVSTKYIKQKLPEVIKFQQELKTANYNYGIFLLNLRYVLRNEPELSDLYNATYEIALQKQRTSILEEERSDVHQYYIIRHKLEKGRKECGPFKEGQIPGLTKRLLPS
jgi:hypothetical protein